MARLFPFLLLLAWISACQPAARFTEEEKQAVTDSVRQALNNYYADIRRSGLTAEFSYLDSSAEFFWVPPGYTTAIPYDSVAHFISLNAPLFNSIENVWDSLRIIPLTNELASYTGQLHSTMTDTSGKTNTYFLIETGLVIKRKDGWKLFNGQTALLPK